VPEPEGSQPVRRGEDERLAAASGRLRAFLSVAAVLAIIDAVLSAGTRGVPPGSPLQLMIMSVPRALLAVCLLAGLLPLARGPRSPAARVALGMDVAAVAGGAITVVWYVLTGPAGLAGHEASHTPRLAAVLLLTDAVPLLGILAVINPGTVASARRSVALLALATVAYPAQDVVRIRGLLAGSSLDRPLWVGIVGLLPCCVIVVAALERVAASHGRTTGAGERDEPRTALVRLPAAIPHLAVAAGYAVLVDAASRDGPLPWRGLALGAAIMMAGVSGRQLVTSWEKDRLVVTDALTGLANRLQLRDVMLRSVPRSARSGEPVGLLLLDLDGFKQVNDAYGHDTGDALLVAFADVLRRSVRRADTVARLGADEFAVYLSGIVDDLDAIAVAKHILAGIHRPVMVGGRPLEIRSSIGIAVAEPAPDRPPGAVVAEMMGQADVAMYAAKRAGSPHWRVYSPGAVGYEDGELDSDLVTALDEGQIQLVYQPLIDVADGWVTGVEALLRWQHPTRGLLAPGSFLPRITEPGNIHKLGIWVLHEACSRVRAWQELLPSGRPLTLFINIAPIQLRPAAFPEEVLEILTETGLETRQLVLDVTEQVVEDEPRAQAVLTRLRSRGVRVALDTAGTEPVSLGHMARFPADAIKLDRSFVAQLPGDEEAVTVATIVQRIAEAMGLEAIAVGVETSPQAVEVAALGYRLAQGSFFCSPLGPELMTSWIPRWGCPGTTPPVDDPRTLRARPSLPWPRQAASAQPAGEAEKRR
jgi:diguanylate cyclase (GGDEF)-like protein